MIHCWTLDSRADGAPAIKMHRNVSRVKPLCRHMRQTCAKHSSTSARRSLLAISSFHSLLPRTSLYHRSSLHHEAGRLPHYVIFNMGATNLLPLVILFAVVGGVAWVGYQVSRHSSAYPITRSRRNSCLLSPAATDLSLHQRTCRARRAQAGEEERRVYQGWRKGWRQGNKRGEVCGQDAESVCEYVECRTGWVRWWCGEVR